MSEQLQRFIHLKGKLVAVTIEWPNGNDSIVGWLVDLYEINGEHALLPFATVQEEEGERLHVINLTRITMISPLDRQHRGI